MISLYPTVHAHRFPHGLAAFEVRGRQLYPTVYNDMHGHGALPMFELRGNLVYPTAHNPIDSIGLPAYEIRGRQLWPTAYNALDGHGQPVMEIR
jgi:hypothetical protein